MTPDVRIQPVATRSDLREFVLLPWKVYRGDPNWVPPLISERLDTLHPAKNPFFTHARAQLFLGRRGRQVVGRIAAFVDQQSNEHLHEAVGGFGFFECLEDYAAATALLDAAGRWVRQAGMSALRGPINFDLNDQPGVLVDGADCPAAVLEGHAPPYYREFLERYGLIRLRENHAWRVSLAALRDGMATFPEQVLRVFSAASERGDISVRKLRFEDWDREVALAHELFDSTLRHLPEHVPLSPAEFRRFADQMRPLLDRDLALFAEADGSVVGFLIAIPDFNQVLLHLNGRLFPFGWLKMLWYSRRIEVISFKLFGVREAYRRRGIDVLLYTQAVRTAIDKGYRWLDGSLTSEFNPTVVRLAERLGAERYKVYRIYQMDFEPAAGGVG
jgi:GNAT superfamily N-acetyltransferase